MNCKIRSIDLDRLLFAICPEDTQERRAKYREYFLDGRLKAKDINMRYRWDLYWVAVDKGFSFPEERGYLPAHVETALKRIVEDLFEDAALAKSAAEF